MFSKILSFLSQFKTLAPVYNFFQGRHTSFAWFFAITGFTLASKGLLTAQYVCLITALQAYVLLHSAKEDKLTPKDSGGDQ